MRTLWIVLSKDLLRMIRSPLMILVFLLFPVVFALLIGMTFGGGHGGSTLAPIRIALVDEDGGFISRLAASAFTQGGGPAKFEVTPAGRAAGMKLVEEDKVSAMMCIPAGFTDSLLAGGKTHLEVVKNPAQSIYPGIVEEFARVLALLGGSASRLLGGPLGEIRDLAASRQGSPTDAFLSRTSVAIGHRMRGVGRYAFPPAIRLDKTPAAADKETQTTTPWTVALFVLPGMATFALLSLAMASTGDLRREETMGTLVRQLSAPVRPGAVILGKALATLVLAFGCILVLSLLVAFWAQAGVSLAGFLVLSFAFAAAATGFATLLQSLFASERTGTALGSILIMVMAMLGGSFIPPEALPPAVRSIAPFTLNHWANDGYRRLLFDSASLRDLWPDLAVLAGIAVSLGGATVLLVRRRFLRGA